MIILVWTYNAHTIERNSPEARIHDCTVPNFGYPSKVNKYIHPAKVCNLMHPHIQVDTLHYYGSSTTHCM